MPIIGLLGTLLFFGCIIHAIKTGRANYWLMILLPGIGSLAYLLFEVLPEARNSRPGRAAVSKVIDSIDPDRGLRQHTENLEIADTADNKRHFAEECIKRGQWDEAIRLYRLALVGPLATEPALLIGLARAHSGAAISRQRLTRSRTCRSTIRVTSRAKAT